MFGAPRSSVDTESFGSVGSSTRFRDDLRLIAGPADSRSPESGTILIEQGRAGLGCVTVHRG